MIAESVKLHPRAKGPTDSRQRRNPGGGQGNKLWHRLFNDRFLYLLILPGVVYFFIFKILPLWGLVISFQNYSPYLGIMRSQWVGLANYAELFADKEFPLLLRNTLGISFLNLLFFFPMPIILSLLINEIRNKHFKSLVQTTVYLPHFLSWVVVAGITFIIFSQSEGIVNKSLVVLHMQSVNVLQNPHTFWGLLITQDIWKESGWGTVLILAAISGIDPQQYEAAILDGASRIKQMWYITLPGIKGIIVTLLILRLGSIMNAGFEQIYLMMNAAVFDVADVFETYVFRVGIQNGQFSYTTAVGLFKSVVGLILVLLADRTAKKLGEEGVY